MMLVVDMCDSVGCAGSRVFGLLVRKAAHGLDGLACDGLARALWAHLQMLALEWPGRSSYQLRKWLDAQATLSVCVAAD